MKGSYSMIEFGNQVEYPAKPEIKLARAWMKTCDTPIGQFALQAHIFFKDKDTQRYDQYSLLFNDKLVGITHDEGKAYALAQAFFDSLIHSCRPYMKPGIRIKV
jgi:hypothetical protein